MTDADQETKKDSKTKKKKIIDSLEGSLSLLKIELIFVILSYIIVILLAIWVVYLKYTYTSELLSTGAQNP
jgi:cell division protein FtsL